MSDPDTYQVAQAALNTAGQVIGRALNILTTPILIFLVIIVLLLFIVTIVMTTGSCREVDVIFQTTAFAVVALVVTFLAVGLELYRMRQEGSIRELEALKDTVRRRTVQRQRAKRAARPSSEAPPGPA